MDPLATWKRLCEACEAGDMVEAADAAADLNGWRLRGGFRPAGIPADVWEPGALPVFVRLCLAVDEGRA
jgi:hypothetical protein